MFMKNKNIIFKIRRSKVTDYAALSLLNVCLFCWISLENTLVPVLFSALLNFQRKLLKFGRSLDAVSTFLTI